MAAKRQLGADGGAIEPLAAVTYDEVDRLLRRRRADRRPHAEKVVVDLLAHMDYLPIEFIMATLKDAYKALAVCKAELDANESAPERLDNALHGRLSMTDIIAAGLLGESIQELAGLLPSTQEDNAPVYADSADVSDGADTEDCPTCSEDWFGVERAS